jgi:hypothetical protein
VQHRLALVRVTGEIDFYAAPKLFAAVNEALADGARSVFMDFAQASSFLCRGGNGAACRQAQCQAEVHSSWSSAPRPPP